MLTLLWEFMIYLNLPTGYRKIDTSLEFSNQGMEILTMILIPRKVAGMKVSVVLPLSFLFLNCSH